MNTINLAFKRTFSSGHNLKMALKNIAAGLGASAILIIALFMLFGGFNGRPGLLASLSGGSADVPVSITIIKDVVPDSEHVSDPTAHMDINFQFAVRGVGGSTGGQNYSNILDDDGVDTGVNEPLNTWTVNVLVAEGGGLFNISETQLTSKYKYNTEIECYYNNTPDKKGRTFGKEVEISLDPSKGQSDITCVFINTLTDAELIVKKIIIPSNSTDVVDFDIYTPNDNEHSNGYDYFSLGDGGTHTTYIATKDENNNPIIYTIGELLGLRGNGAPEWDNKYDVSYECVDANGNVTQTSASNPKNDKGTFELNPFNEGDVITCTFTNTRNGEFIARKLVDPVPQNNTEGFAFKLEQQRNGIFTQPAEFNLSHGETSVSFYPKYNWQQIATEVLSPEQNTKYWTSYVCKLYNGNGDYVGDDVSDPGHDPVYEYNLTQGEKKDCTFTNHLLEMTVIKKVIDKDGNENTNDKSVFKFKTNQEPKEFNLIGDGNPNNSEKKINFTTTNDVEIEEVLTNEQKFLYSTSYECKDRDGNGIKNDIGTKVVLTGLTQNSNGIICTFTNTELPDAQIFVHMKFQPEDLDDVARVRVFPSGNPTKGKDKEILHDHNQTWDVRPGDVTVHEFQILQNNNNPTKAYTQSYVCDFLAPSTRPDITSNTSIIDIPGILSGDRVQCTLINKEVTSVIKIVKNVVGSNGVDITDDPTVFNFDSTKGTFKLDENLDATYPSEKVFIDLIPGNYSFGEVVPQGYEASYKCIDDKTQAVVKEGTGGDILDLAIVRNQGITCTFTNIKAIATIIIKKDVRGPNGDITDDKEVFKITSNTKVPEFFLDDNTSQAPESTQSIDVTAGVAYNFTEALNSNQIGEYNVSYKCTDVNQTSGNGTTFTAPILGKNESITCTFTNTKVVTQIIIKKDVVSDDGTDIIDDKEVFNIENTTSNSDFFLDDNTDPTYSNQMVLDVTPNTNYSFLEDLSPYQESNYTVSWECKINGVVYKSSSGVTISNVKVSKGETMICVVKNTKKSFKQKIIIKKVTVPGGATEIFAINLFKGNTKIGGNILLKDGQSNQQIVPADAYYRLYEVTSPGHPVNSYSCRYIPGDLSTYKPFSGNGRYIPYSTPNTNPHPTFFLPKGHDIECTFKNCKNGLLCPLIGDPQDPDPTGDGGSSVGGGGGNQ